MSNARVHKITINYHVKLLSRCHFNANKCDYNYYIKLRLASIYYRFIHFRMSMIAADLETATHYWLLVSYIKKITLKMFRIDAGTHAFYANWKIFCQKWPNWHVQAIAISFVLLAPFHSEKKQQQQHRIETKQKWIEVWKICVIYRINDVCRVPESTFKQFIW